VNKVILQKIGIRVGTLVTFLCIAFSFVLLSHSNSNGFAFAQSNSNTTEFKALRDQYLQSWEKLNFQSVMDTYVVGGTDSGYGVYEERGSNTFAPGETLYLYVEPVAFSHKQTLDSKGNTLYSIDMSADITITSSGTIVASIKNLPVSKLVSHQKNTEIFLLLSLSQSQPFPKGEYEITYVVKDNPSGKTFDIVKNIKIA
jgi:hypothetical protein